MCGSYPSRPIKPTESIESIDPSANSNKQEYKTLSKTKIDRFDDISVKQIEIQQKFMDHISFDTDIEYDDLVKYIKNMEKNYLESFFIDDFKLNMEKIEYFMKLHKSVMIIHLMHISQTLFRKYEHNFLKNNLKRKALNLEKLEALDLSIYDIKKSGLEFIINELSECDLKDTILIFIHFVLIHRDRRINLMQEKIQNQKV